MRMCLPLAVLLCACDLPQAPAPSSDDLDPTPDPFTSPAPSPAPPPERPKPGDDLGWSGCDDGAQCATAAVPLRWEAPGDGAIELWVKRYPARRSSGQLWLLQGGPGGAAEGLESYVPMFRAAAPTLDIYLTDHRGVGHSTRLGCGVWSGDAISERCIRSVLREWGDDLSAFTPTAAAYDLGHLVDRVRGPGDRAFIYGVSYGTYWAHRYLQLFPDQPDGVVLDSICPPGGCRYALFDARFDEVGRSFLERCAGDAFCRDKLGADPVGRADRLYGRLRSGHCPAFQRGERTLEDLRRVMAALLANWEFRVLVPALLHRLDRCDPDDAAFANWLVPDGLTWAPHDRGLDSVVLQYHVLISEMWGTDDGVEQVRALEARTLFATGGPAWMARLRPVWPAYTPDDLASEWADVDTPLLMLNGTLDPQTPLFVADAARLRFRRPGQHFVAVDDAAHGVVAQSPVAGGGAPCGLLMLASFLHDPSSPVRSGCLRRLRRIDFRGDALAADLGLEDLWRGGPSAGAPGFGLRKSKPRPWLKRPVWRPSRMLIDADRAAERFSTACYGCARTKVTFASSESSGRKL